ncbi:hypothetical protein [Escherichia coli]|uniref:hypothetical protein n=1 Tax=Escherichia coli TaxID=562 RepID=UPI001CDCE7FC|nr:hypothetical protein [Escherichia coli]
MTAAGQWPTGRMPADEQLKNNPDFEKNVREKYNAAKGFMGIVDTDAFHESVNSYLTPEKTFDFSLPAAQAGSAGKQDDPLPVREHGRLPYRPFLLRADSPAHS